MWANRDRRYVPESVQKGHSKHLSKPPPRPYSSGKKDMPPVTPWRHSDPWNTQSLDTLKKDIRQVSVPAEFSINHMNILLLGQVGAGKSSFFNTVSSAFRREVSQQARCGSAATSLTETFRMYKVRDTDDSILNFRLCDSRGLEENVNEDEIKLILDGYLSDGYKHGTIVARHYLISKLWGYLKGFFMKYFTQPREHPAFRRCPSMSDKMHCVCFVLDGTTVEILSEAWIYKLKRLKKICDEKDIPVTMMLTKADKICANVAGNTSAIFQSQVVKAVVDKAVDTFELKENNVLLVKNYESETTKSVNTEILALVCLKSLLSRARDYLLNKCDYDHTRENIPAHESYVINMPE